MPEPRKRGRAPQVILEPWLEAVAGESPVLLIAPHGGRAGSATRALLNPKVNDLYTAEITRALSARLSAAALINGGMDRNHLDLNRLSQVTANAPWFLEAILERVAEIVARHRRATVLLVHGWNVIQPRVDLGLGLRRHGGELRPPGSARVSASDEFIHGPLATLAERLRAHGITASFGLRYPAGGAQNLLQAFTDRHLENPIGALRELSAMCSRREVEAVQLELSVALRMPGEYRERCIDAIAQAFGAPCAASRTGKLTVVRSPAARPAATAKPAAPAAPPSRVGVELFDPAAEIGAMASFDLGVGGVGGVGARIMVLLPGGRVALFTGEGKSQREGARVTLGPLALESDRGALVLKFRGPAVIVPDATNYLSIERALASGWLDASMEAELRVEPRVEGFDLREMFDPGSESPREGAPVAAFGKLSGHIRADGAAADLSGFGRGGLSFTALGPQRFASRRMIWACFDEESAPAALELRAVSADGVEHRTGRILNPGGWAQCEVGRIEVETSSVSSPPESLSAEFSAAQITPAPLLGEVANFVPLSRPGPGNTRIFTSLGFARFRLGACRGAGMFEFSRRADGLPALSAQDEDTED